MNIQSTPGTVSQLPTQAAAVPAKAEGPQDPIDILACPTPKIDRPFVLVPGWTTTPKNLQGLGDLLTRDKANGGEVYYVKQGHILEQDAKGDLEPLKGSAKAGRVFEMVFTDTRQGPDKNLPEMRENFEAITKATGFKKVDAEGYSMGGDDTKLYLKEGGNDINKFFMLGTPNQGTEFGEKVHDALKDHLDLLTDIAHISEKDADAMEWLRLEKNSPELQSLNASFPAEAARTNGVLSVGDDGLATLAPGDLPIELHKGDGTVPATSLSLPGLTTEVLHDHTKHGILNDNENVETVRANFFGWKLPPAHS